MTGLVALAPPARPSHSCHWRLAGGLAVVTFTAYLLGGGTVQWDWTRTERAASSTRTADPAPDPAGAAQDQAQRAGIDLDQVVDVVAHRVVPVPGRLGVMESIDDRYRAVFDASGFALDEFGVSLSAVRQGDAAVPLELGTWRGQDNVASRRVSAGVTERVTARDGELEWDVVLDRRLRGDGDLVIEARLSGTIGEATRTEDGLSFGAGAATVHMGELVVKDAHGRELHRAAPQAADDRVALVVPARVLADAAYPVTVDPTVSPEHPVSDAVTSAAPDAQIEPAVAFDGTTYLVAWEDHRTGVDGDIYGTRVSRAGVVLDPSGIAISTGSADEVQPAVAFDGANHLVAWTDRRSGPGGDIYGARVSPAGAVLDSGGIAISTAPNAQVEPAVAFDGTNHLVAWTDARSGTDDIYGTRVSPGGTVLDSAGVAISTAPNGQFQPTVAFDGTNHLVAWTDARSGTLDIYGTRVSPGGTVLDSAGIAISTAPNGQFLPAVAFDGTNYLVAWTDLRSATTNFDIFGGR